MSSPFQESAKSKLANVLAEHGIDQEFQESEDADGRPWMFCVFEWKGEEHQIEIFEDTVVVPVWKSGPPTVDLFVGGGSVKFKFKWRARATTLALGGR